MLRSGELCSLTQGHLIVDDDDDNFYGFCIVATEQPKTKYTAGRVQHVLTTCAWVSFYLSRCPICGCHGYNNFLRREKMLLKALILHPVWTPAGLRPGGGHIQLPHRNVYRSTAITWTMDVSGRL